MRLGSFQGGGPTELTPPTAKGPVDGQSLGRQGSASGDPEITVYLGLAIRFYVSTVGASPTLDSWPEPQLMIIGGVMFVIEDERHAEPQGKFVNLEEAVVELRRRSRILWNEEPNQAPCMSWRTCGRAYELIEYDDTQAPWTELRRFAALEISSRGVKWSREFEELARGNKFQ
jgi:hypothetical protein